MASQSVEVRGARNILSNFYISRKGFISYQGDQFCSVEHAYQFAKAVHYGCLALAKQIRKADTAYVAKQLAHSLPRKGSWDCVKVEVMRALLQIKFDDIPEFKEELLNTKGKLITHPVKDSFWGRWNMQGRDKFAELLMNLRDNPHKETGRFYQTMYVHVLLGSDAKTMFKNVNIISILKVSFSIFLSTVWQIVGHHLR